MPSPNSELPEGTDHIVKGAARTSGAVPAGGSDIDTAATGAGIATARKDDTGGATTGQASGGSGASVREQITDQIASLKSQAGEKVREYCDDGKNRASGALDEFSKVIDDAAQSIDERIGSEYGEYAHKAADYVASFADTVRNKDLNELVDDTRQAVRKSPGIAIATAAVLGFAVVRLLKTGLDDVSGKSGSGHSGRSTNIDTGA